MFCVKVPVLSVQIIFTDPNISTAGSLLTMAFLLDILVTPKAKTIATIAANPSGIAATAKLIAVKNISNKSFPCKYAIAKIKTHTPTAINPKTLPNSSSLSCRGVSSLSSSRFLAMVPISVSIPVLTTIPSPLP